MIRQGKNSAYGLTLIELLVALVILSIVATAALPYAEMTVRRDKEFELRRALREMRAGIDNFHEDWVAGRIPQTADSASEDGYPKSLQSLVQGTDSGQAKGSKRRYLRRIPRDPFGDPSKAPSDQWVLRGYQDDADSMLWSGRDVYDVHSVSNETAIDGTHYKDW